MSEVKLPVYGGHDQGYEFEVVILSIKLYDAFCN